MSDTPENTAKKTVGVPFAKGADVRRGHGVKGRSGRPPNEYREGLRRILDDPKVSKAVKAILGNPDHPQFASLYGKVVSQAHGNPLQPIDMNVDGMPPFVVTVETDKESE